MSFAIQQTKGAVPDARTQSSVSVVGANVFMFGGTKDSEAFDEVHILNTANWTWTKAVTTGSKPAPRWGHSSTVVGKMLYIFGGNSVGGLLNDLYVLDTDTLAWSKPDNVSGVTPAPRACHSATLVAGNNSSSNSNSNGGRLFVYGGEGIDAAESALVVLDLAKLSWSIPQQTGDDGAPEPRKGHVAATHKKKLLLYGGWGNRIHQYLDDVWSLDVDTFKWTKAKRKGPVPEPRGGACGTVFGNLFFVWGGWGAGAFSWNEVHYMDAADFTWLKRKPKGTIPKERYYHASAVIKEQQLLIFGGQLEDKSHTNEVFVLNTSSVY